MQRRVTVFGALTIAALATATGIAGAQTVPFGGGPLARGSVVSISGSTIELKGTNPQDGSENDVTVTVSGSTAYRKIQTTGATSIASGDCVRVAGSGTVAKGRIKASTISITGTSAADCRRGFGGNGLRGGRGGFGQGGANGDNGTAPRSFPGGAGRFNGRGRNGAGIAFGTVQSIFGGHIVVKAATFSRPSNSNATPKLKTKKVTVSISSSTVITETVSATVGDVAVGECVTAAGTGDAQAVTADTVTISQPTNGSCALPRFGGGGGRFT